MLYCYCHSAPASNQLQLLSNRLNGSKLLNEFDDPVFFSVPLFILLLLCLFRRLTEPKGFIHDGLGNYSIGVKCSWLIDARGPYQPSSNVTKTGRKKPKLIRLHLEEFATECSWDHLYIYDGDSVQSPLLAVFR